MNIPTDGTLKKRKTLLWAASLAVSSKFNFNLYFEGWINQQPLLIKNKLKMERERIIASFCRYRNANYESGQITPSNTDLSNM